ncbi:hypothetical protein O6H91_04G037500 [Diphasiastrum complanatum]|uniref:Uncharacterized protein n=1 Tax=Diphasiastrum complanatum TaxID=34168 RepID=A0ACC2DVV4_DIPCM|nr:hypothetical protein O6H91_04G037500 [Diphasiastrum complanatum]
MAPLSSSYSSFSLSRYCEAPAMAATVLATFPALLSDAASSSFSAFSLRSHSSRSSASISSMLMGSLPERKFVRSHMARPSQATSAEGCRCLDRRQLLGISTILPFLGLGVSDFAFGLLEADDDEALLEKVKVDRQKRLQKREALNSFKKETASVQNAVYNLSRVGEALDVSDYKTASSILGASSGDAEWVVQVKDALLKVSMSADEQVEADQFSSSLSSLQTAGFTGDKIDRKSTSAFGIP